jgi:hypothetical protein
LIYRFDSESGFNQPHPLPRQVVREYRIFQQYPAFRVLFLRPKREIRTGYQRALSVNNDALRMHVEPWVRRHCAPVVVDMGKRRAKWPNLLQNGARFFSSIPNLIGQDLNRLLNVNEEVSFNAEFTHAIPERL